MYLLSSLAGEVIVHLQMFGAGLNDTLIDSLRDLTVHTPMLNAGIQQKLLDLLSQVLANKVFGLKRQSSFISTPITQQVWKYFMRKSSLI